MTGIAERARGAFLAHFGARPAITVRAPGRVNLIGEHTDYNDGFVLPCAIDRGTVVVAAPASGAITDVISVDYGATDAFDPAAPFAPSVLSWQTHVRAVAAAFAATYGPAPAARIAIAGDVPQGAGLSSSASLGVALAASYAALAGITNPDPTMLARVAQAAENDFVGCACGIMDQLIAARGEAGAALLIDCRSLEVTPVPLADDMAVLIVHSGITRGLVDSAYNDRRRACELVARHCRVAALRDLDMAALDRQRDALDATAFRRARHVIGENARVLDMTAAIRARDWQAIGALMAASHASMRDDFAITLPPIDALVARLVDAAGDAGGARMTGGGFGGCVVALARRDRLPVLKAAALAHFQAAGTVAGLIHETPAGPGLTIDG